MSKQIETYTSVQRQVWTFLRQHPQMSLTSTSAVTTLAASAHFGFVGFVVGGFGTYWLWKQGGKIKAIPATRIVESRPQMGNIDQQKSERTFVERLKRLFDPNADGPHQPIPGIVKEERYNAQEAGPDVVEAVLPVEPAHASQSVLEQHLDAQPDEDDIYLSRTLCPHADDVLSNRAAILGIPGAGKSNTVAVIAEELGRFGVPLIIFDTENEYKPLCAQPYFKRPFVADCSNVNLETAFSFGQRIMDERLQVVLNLDSYDDDDLAALIMIDIIKGIQRWEEALSNDDRIPCAIILDEAAVWLPQNAGESMLSKDKDEDGLTILAKLQKIFFSVVVRRGRKRGIGFILASQRSAEIDKRAIASAQWKFLHLQNMPNDLDIYAQFGVDKVTAQALGRGQAFVIGPGVKGVHQMRKRNSPDNAQTPGLESLRKRRYTESLVGRAAQMSLPITEPTRVVEVRPAGQSHMSHYPSPKLHPTLERALKHYNEGCTTSRPLAQAMNVGKDTANGYIRQLRDRKLIV